MRRIITISCIAMIFIGLISSTVYSQTAEEILEKIIEAQGGRKVLAGIEDTTMSGSMQMVAMNLNGSMTMYQKEPDKMRMDIEMMGMQMTQAFDGKTAWAINPQPGNAQEMPEKLAKEFKRQAIGNDALLNPQKYGITYTFKGKEKIDDKEYLVLEQNFKDGHNATLYIDPATYLTYKVKTTTLNQVEAEVESESFPSDYKKVDGLMIPHKITVYQGGQEFMNLTFSEVTINSGLEDSFFKME